jgi:ureidoacrylate peracid hydrolase
MGSSRVSNTTAVFDVFSAHHRSPSPIRFAPETTALLIVDMLNDFLEPGGLMVLEGGAKLYGPVNALTAGVRQAEGHVVWVMDRHAPGDREFRKRAAHCLEGTWGAEIPPTLHVEAHDHVSVKRRFSAFFQTDLDLWLRERSIETVIVCGVVTNICVRSTVHDAFFLGYEVIVATDACAGTTPREQDSSLYDIATHFGSLASSSSLLVALAHPAHPLELVMPNPPIGVGGLRPGGLGDDHPAAGEIKP